MAWQYDKCGSLSKHSLKFEKLLKAVKCCASSSSKTLSFPRTVFEPCLLFPHVLGKLCYGIFGGVDCGSDESELAFRSWHIGTSKFHGPKTCASGDRWMDGMTNERHSNRRFYFETSCRLILQF